MAEFTIMNMIDFFLLILLSISATWVVSLIYMQYQRVISFQRLKEVVFVEDTELAALLNQTRVELNEKQSMMAKFRSQLVLAGVKLPIVVVFGLIFIFTLFVDFLYLVYLEHWSGLIIGTPFSFLLVYMFINRLIRIRKKEFNRALATAISVLVKMMKNGIGFEQALYKSIGVSSSKLLKEVFQNFFKEKNTIGEVQAFEAMYKYVDSKELRIFALAIKIGRESGGQFSNTLAKVEQTIAYRKKMQDKVDILTREGNIGTYMVVGIAVLLYFMLNGNFDGKVHEYFMDSEFGRFQLLGIMLWIFFGMLANNFFTRVDR